MKTTLDLSLRCVKVALESKETIACLTVGVRYTVCVLKQFLLYSCAKVEFTGIKKQQV